MEIPKAGNPETFEVPFGEIVAFSTNLSSLDLADEPFLPRIGYKFKGGYARPQEYVEIFREIFRRECARLGITFHPEAVRHLIKRGAPGREDAPLRLPPQRHREPGRGDLPVRGKDSGAGGGVHLPRLP